MAEKKMTRKEALENVFGWIADGYIPSDEATVEEVREVLDKMYAQVTKPRKKAEGPSKAHRDNERLAHDMADAIAEKGERVTSKWVTEHVRGIMTPQKATAVARVGIDLGLLTREKEGKVIYYNVAE